MWLHLFWREKVRKTSVCKRLGSEFPWLLVLHSCFYILILHINSVNQPPITEINCYLAFSFYTNFPTECSIQHRAAFWWSRYTTSSFELVMKSPSIEIIAILYGGESQSYLKCKQYFVSGKWNRIHDFHSTKHFIAQYLVPSPTEILIVSFVVSSEPWKWSLASVICPKLLKNIVE